MAVQHQPSGRVERVGEVATARRGGSAEHQLARPRRPFVGPAHRHAVTGDDERSVGDEGRGPRYEPEADGIGEATVVRGELSSGGAGRKALHQLPQPVVHIVLAEHQRTHG